MPRGYRGSIEQRPFSLVVNRWMWRHEPPWTSGQLRNYLAQRGLSVPKTSLLNWTMGRTEPPIEQQAEILDALGEPLASLIDAYRELGLPAPLLLTRPLGAPAPKQRGRTLEPPQDEWETMIDITTQAMRASGISEEAIAQVVAHIRQKQRDERPLQRHLIAEHAPDEGLRDREATHTDPLSRR